MEAAGTMVKATDPWEQDTMEKRYSGKAVLPYIEIFDDVNEYLLKAGSNKMR